MDKLNIVQGNAQSLLGHKHIFTLYLYQNDIHIALISETWLQSSKVLNFKEYKIERLDIGSKHNGVAILIRNYINWQQTIIYKV